MCLFILSTPKNFAFQPLLNRGKLTHALSTGLGKSWPIGCRRSWAIGRGAFASALAGAGAFGSIPQPWRQSAAFAEALANRGSSRQDRGKRRIDGSSDMDRRDSTQAVGKGEGWRALRLFISLSA